LPERVQRCLRLQAHLLLMASRVAVEARQQKQRLGWGFAKDLLIAAIEMEVQDATTRQRLRSWVWWR
jgi:hypothetical protein